jgi:hypothetical protein
MVQGSKPGKIGAVVSELGSEIVRAICFRLSHA